MRVGVRAVVRGRSGRSAFEALSATAQNSNEHPRADGGAHTERSVASPMATWTAWPSAAFTVMI